LELVKEKRLALINPPSSLLAQTKATQALIWSLYETESFFTSEEHAAIGKYMLPTYLHNPFHGQEAYVSKPILGREGGAITVYDAKGSVRERDRDDYYWQQPMVYQKYVDLQEVTVNTLSGPKTGRILWGAFYFHGRPSAIGARWGGLITDTTSYFLPISVK
jgi:glutathionylspermidine synthase